MIVTTPRAFLDALAAPGAFPVHGPATARAAFLVSPLQFSLAAESASDNAYMDMAGAPDASRALAEHAELARRLSADVPIVTFPGDPEAPDGVFPNNVFATTPGRLVVGRMRHAVRRREAERRDIRAWFTGAMGYAEHDLSNGDFVAELTGSLVIDRARGIGYCGLSERCDLAGARAMHEAFGLALTFCFDLAEGEYHTNVVLALLAGRAAIIAPSGFRDPEVPAAIARVFGDAAITIDEGQKAAFCGNAIALSPRRAWFSTRAAEALLPAQRATLDAFGLDVGHVPLVEIEKAGGSLRCCVAEIF